nr:CRISPR-associated endoribonuclease Cas6 [uncultured Anaerocolumna sp.]
MVYELISKVYLLNDISLSNMRDKITNLIDETLAKDEYYLSFHRKNTFKNYSYDNFYNVENDGVYREGKIYSFRIRTVDAQLSNYLEKALFTAYTSDMKVLTVTKRTIPKKYLERIFSITPIVIKTEEGYWRTHVSIEEFEKKLRNNLIKNYNTFYNTKINEDFELFTYIEFNNQKPITVPFKNNITLLGDKVTFHVSENEMAQKLTYFAIGVGIGECGSRGCGFIGYQYL